MNPKNRRIAPSLLSADFANLADEIAKVTEAGADWLHVDVMDGHFVPNITIGAPVVKSLRKVTRLPLDCHLMIEEPEKYIKDFAAAGADIITVHVEASDDVAKLLKDIRALGCRVGLSLRPGTPAQAIEPYLDALDLVLVMTVEPGFGGQSFMLDQIEKIAWFRQRLDEVNPQAVVEVDGGVNDKTLQHCLKADVLVAGSYVFKNDYKQAIRTLKGQ